MVVIVTAGGKWDVVWENMTAELDVCHLLILAGFFDETVA